MNQVNLINNFIDELGKKLGLETNKKKITPINSIKITRDLLSDNSIIINTFKKYYPILENDRNFKHLYEIVINKKYAEQIIISSNHYDNLLLSIYFILGNPYLFHSEIFEILYQNRYDIEHVLDIVKKSWSYILKSNLRNFFNSTLIEKWLQTSQFKKLQREDIFKNKENTEEIYNKYNEIYNIFDNTNKKIVQFILELRNLITTVQTPGSYNLRKDYYVTFQKTYSGLTLSNKNLITLMVFAHKELLRLVDEMRTIVTRIHPETNEMDIKEIIIFLQDFKDYKYETKDDYIKHHIDIMKSLENFFITNKKIIQFIKPKITAIDDENLGGAYWAYDTFYLNVANWNNINNYQALSLALHEGIPGHHTQVSYQVHSESNGYDILYEWFGTTSGFHEGWALFTEKLAPSYTDIEKIGQLQYEMLRTIRIIVDISIHEAGISSEEIKKYMMKYLAIPSESIDSEIFRYIVLPGQALGYKIGEVIFKYIHKKLIGTEDYLCDKSIELYKKIIYDKAMPLDILMENYNITFDEIFNLDRFKIL